MAEQELMQKIKLYAYENMVYANNPYKQFGWYKLSLGGDSINLEYIEDIEEQKHLNDIYSYSHQMGAIK